MLGFEKIAEVTIEYFTNHVVLNLAEQGYPQFSVSDGMPLLPSENNYFYVDCNETKFMFEVGSRDFHIEVVLFLNPEFKQSDASKIMDIIMSTFASENKFPANLPFSQVSFHKYDKTSDENFICVIEMSGVIPLTQLDNF